LVDAYRADRWACFILCNCLGSRSFQKSGLKPETQSATKLQYQPLHTNTDLYTVISRAVGELTINNFATRRELYRKARNALHNQLRGQERSHTEKEWRALEHAIRKVEEERRLVEPKPTGLLVTSILFPALWASDFTSMSLYWVARLPRMR
jgi:hypothetical protein